ncbi:zinc/iron-chelating domain-containing protein [Candidatus Aerophobetes bacterium]|uniref:Zinc/iron-chelating domain-containing protein n=1 Tax=Aerophobetes bacterium TaxID=2030807 RepID=A0A2A4X7E6_UNCAE|nr:MAG: zinc/iron-chelating domain-containing protein [Candidatus Aerophobetes bacterium]
MVEKSDPSHVLNVINKQPWYSEGVRFHCTGCGACCESDGLVILTKDDVERASNTLNIQKDAFIKQYTQKFGKHLCLIDQPDSTKCIFLNREKGCKIYSNRPKQCSTFPFWKDLMRSKRCWDEEKQLCEGLDHPEGKLYSSQEIDAIIQS